MKRLGMAALTEVSNAVQLPGYDRESKACGIVHLGLGAFHRAHQAVYTDQAMSNSGGDWRITGVSLRSATVAGRLQPQDCLYSVLSEHGEQWSLRVIGAVKEVLVAPRELAKVVAAIAAPATRIISLTITEKGYCLAADGRTLDISNEALRADRKNPAAPTTAIGVLALGLKRRKELGSGPVSLLSCDNLSENGKLLATVLLDYAAEVFPGLVTWLTENCTFPSSMVDRIVPAATPARQLRQAGLLGLEDAGAIATEPFSQWIIEDSFCTEKPDWQSAGVQFVDDILPYEQIKLRLLNGSHSAIAYCGLLADLNTVDEVTSDPCLGAFVERLMTEELMPSLRAPANFDLPGYRDELLKRFGNTSLAHRCQQIAMDGSEKISQRWLPALQAGGQQEMLHKALAAWCYYVLCTELEIDDPQRDALLALRQINQGLPVAALLACARINAGNVEHFGDLCTELEQGLRIIGSVGVRVFCQLRSYAG